MREACSRSEGIAVKLTEEPWLKSCESFQNHPLMGCTLSQIGQILWENWKEIDFLVFAPRVVMLVLLASMNSIFAVFDWMLYRTSLRRTSIPPRPLFIIGQPRSGTTLLLNLFNLDEQFVSPNTFQVGWGSSFLTLERFGNCWPLSAVLSPTRPMDNLPLNWGTPQEDEVAVNALSGGASPYTAICFMRSWRRFMGLIKFEGRLSEFERWKNAVLHLARKLAFKSPGRRLLFKSPVHTGRIKILRELFGHDAQFVFVHRHPDAIFESNWRALIDKYMRPYTALQTFDGKDAQEYILEHGRLLHEAYVEDCGDLPTRQHARVAFSDLCADQVGTMKSIYEQLGMADSFERVRPAIVEHQAQVAQFQPNIFPPMDGNAKDLVRTEWDGLFTEFGYQK